MLSRILFKTSDPMTLLNRQTTFFLLIVFSTLVLTPSAPQKALTKKAFPMHSDMRMGEIVAEFGFTDESHLNKFSRKNKGIRPAVFRKQSGEPV